MSTRSGRAYSPRKPIGRAGRKTEVDGNANASESDRSSDSDASENPRQNLDSDIRQKGMPSSEPQVTSSIGDATESKNELENKQSGQATDNGQNSDSDCFESLLSVDHDATDLSESKPENPREGTPELPNYPNSPGSPTNSEDHKQSAQPPAANTTTEPQQTSPAHLPSERPKSGAPTSAAQPSPKNAPTRIVILSQEVTENPIRKDTAHIYTHCFVLPLRHQKSIIYSM